MKISDEEKAAERIFADALDHESTPQEIRWCEIERAASGVIESMKDHEGAMIPYSLAVALIELKTTLTSPLAL